MITTKNLKQTIQAKLDKNVSLLSNFETTLTVTKAKAAWRVVVENDYRKVKATITPLEDVSEVLLESEYGYCGRFQGIYKQEDLDLIADILNRQI